MSGAPNYRTTVELLKALLDANGELHIDARLVRGLIRFIEIDEAQLTAAQTCIRELRETVDKYIGHPSEPTNT